MRTIVVMPSLPEIWIERIREATPGFSLVLGDDKEAIETGLKEAEIICGWNAEAEAMCLRFGTPLRWIQAWGAGVDKLPLDRLASLGITLTTASGVHPNPVSETAFAMMLSLSRRLHVSMRNQQSASWQAAGDLIEMHGKTIGIIGVGAIGEEIALLAKAFKMTTLGVRRSGLEAEYIDRMYDINGLNSVLAESDYIVACMPLTAETRHLFSYEQFELMKPSAYFINVSRGATVHTDSMIEALKQGRIAGAGLDVFEQEPLPSNHPLWQLDNVIITPHNGGVTDQYTTRAAEIFLANLKTYVQGQQPTINLVHTDRQY